MPAVSEQTATNPLILPNSANIDEETAMTRSSDGGGDRRKQRIPAPSWSLGEYAKSIVYGGMDAIVSCFSLISSISGGRMSSGDVLVLGFANLVADGISMGFGDYVSTATEKNMALKEREDTVWETRDGTLEARARMEKSLIQRYMDLGMDFDDASTVVNIFSKYNKVIVEEILALRKAICPTEETEKPWKNGLVTFGAFIAFGCAPLLSFIVLMPFTQNESFKFAGACILSMLALALLGFAKAKMSGENYMLSALMCILNGAIAAAVAYAVGWTLRNVAGLEDL